MDRDSLHLWANEHCKMVRWGEYSDPFKLVFHVENHQTDHEIIRHEVDGDADSVCGIHLDLAAEGRQVIVEGSFIHMPGVMLRIEGYDPVGKVFVCSLVESDPALEYEVGDAGHSAG